jgi:hypothetical protein
MKVSELFEDEERSVLSVMGQRPEHCYGNFRCSDKDIESLKGAPKSVSHSVFCSRNKFSSLDGVPSEIGDNLYFEYNNLTTLHNIHKYIKKIGNVADFRWNPITSHVLGLLLIDGLKVCFLDNTKVEVIINKHLKGERDVFACQEELIENGFEDFAQL